MNDKETKLIESLAAKLGTTAEYLWSVLIKQAPIQSAISLFQISLILLAAWGLYRLHLKCDKEDTDDKYHRSLYSEYYGVGIGMYCLAVAVLILLITSLFSLESVITGFVNPEYWALNKILQSIK